MLCFLIVLYCIVIARCLFFLFLFAQEMGLTDEDLTYIGVRNAAQRRALKMGAKGFVELMLQVEISAFFNFHSELVRFLYVQRNSA